MSTKKIELLTEGVVDTLVLYSFLKKLTTPFEQWDAYKLGIIDDSGKVLRKRNTLTKPEERRAFNLFDVLVLNIKKMIEKLPGGKSRLATFIAGLFLIREQKHTDWYQNEDILYEAFMDFYESSLDDDELQKEIVEYIKKNYPDIYKEEAPANSVGTGAGLAGLTEPVVRNLPKPKRKRKNFRDYV